MAFDVKKYATEVRPITIDFTGALPSGETLVAGSTVTAVNSLGVDASAALLGTKTVASPDITIIIKATAAGTYVITFTAITTPTTFSLVEYVNLTVL
jgi:hypothetical protein